MFSRIDDNSDSNLNFQNQKNIEPVEITRARSVILDLNSAVRQYRLETARRIADTSFLDDMSTPPGGTQVIKISAKQSRKLKKANKTPKAQRSEQSKFVIAISLKAIAIVTIAVSAIVIVAKLTEQN